MGDSSNRILVVDDHEDTRMMTALLLNREGYYVRSAKSVAEALQLCDQENFDLLIGDIGLPDGNGFDLMRALAAKCNIKGIACTGFGNKSDIARAAEAGFAAHLTKPIDINILLRTVKVVLAQAA